MTLKIHRNTGVSFKSHTPGRPRPCLEWCGREGQWETDICHFIFLINSWWVGKPGLEFHFAFPSLGVFDWLQGEHGIKSCSERNIRECKNILGFTKPKMGKRGWGRLSFPVFSSYSLLKWGLSDNRSECTRTGDTAARSVAGDGSRVVGLASFAALSWEKDLEYTSFWHCDRHNGLCSNWQIPLSPLCSMENSETLNFTHTADCKHIPETEPQTSLPCQVPECWGLARNHRLLQWRTEEKGIQPDLCQVLEYTMEKVKQSHWTQRESECFYTWVMKSSLNKMARRNILKGEKTVVKTTPYHCNATVCTGDEARSLGTLVSPGLSSGTLISHLTHCEAGAKTTPTPWGNAHSRVQIIQVWCPVKHLFLIPQKTSQIYYGHL